MGQGLFTDTFGNLIRATDSVYGKMCRHAKSCMKLQEVHTFLNFKLRTPPSIVFKLREVLC